MDWRQIALERKVSRVGLKTNINKIKVLSMTSHRTFGFFAVGHTELGLAFTLLSKLSKCTSCFKLRNLRQANDVLWPEKVSIEKLSRRILLVTLQERTTNALLAMLPMAQNYKPRE